MERDEHLAVFGYAFPHRKTQDVLSELAFSGFRKVTVLAAPWKQLKNVDNDFYFEKGISAAGAAQPHDVCKAFGFNFSEVDHDDVAAIRSIFKNEPPNLAIIGGARILKAPVIECFSEGILNLHPGKIPETSGLDSFFYTIANGSEPGVTAHYIDRRIDAGDILFFEPTDVGANDCPSIVQHNIYQTQIRALQRFIRERDADDLAKTVANRPNKNPPMDKEQKRNALFRFADWRSAQVHSQAMRRLFQACADGEMGTVGGILDRFPYLIDQKNEFGWTPLIVASFHQRKAIVRMLLEMGADPNLCGKNGTTPLMYAKTALLNTNSPDTDILDLLISAGCEVDRFDKNGFDIYHYLSMAGDFKISSWLRERTGAFK